MTRIVLSLIVSKSEPIPVIVENPSPPAIPHHRRLWFIPYAILAACTLLTIVSSVFRSSTTNTRRRLFGILWREWFWNSLLAAVALLMWLDHRHQISQIFDTSRDDAAKWSIRLADEE